MSQTRITVQDGETLVIDDPCPQEAREGHEALRLFEPAPVQMPGQMDIRLNADE